MKLFKGRWGIIVSIEINKEDKYIEMLINGEPVGDVIDCVENEIFVQCEQEHLYGIKLEVIPQELSIMVHSSDGFDTYLFHELIITRSDKDFFLEYRCHEYNKYWEGRWGLGSLLNAIKNEVESLKDVELTNFDIEDTWKKLNIKVKYSNKEILIEECISQTSALVKELIEKAKAVLEGFQWKNDYETSEAAFCLEVLHPLLRKMGFISIRYTHGTKEFGKDFTFSQLTEFGTLRHYGLQAKAGNVNGGVNSSIDELIGQVQDAFSMPYHEVSANEQRYISTFIIAISGTFTDNAKNKIANKIPQGLVGSILFLDKDSIFELVEKYWTKVK